MQQELIDDLLQEALSKDATLEKTANQMSEPIFIKNLENVQGDERDVILFSITFGPDETGKFYQNFGPLAKKGGWRRLNVAVSRARSQMMVFSSITAEDISLTAHSSEGVIGLKNFLAFAQKGLTTIEKRRVKSEKETEGILRSIQLYLQEHGFESDLYFGASDLQIDLAVRHPQHPSIYLAAILIDGQQYKQFNTSRDRNRLLNQVLRFKGWNIYRIWTLDYFENKNKVLAKLESFLNHLLLEEPAAQESAVPPVPQPVLQTVHLQHSTADRLEKTKAAEGEEAMSTPVSQDKSEAKQPPTSYRSLQTEVWTEVESTVKLNPASETTTKAATSYEKFDAKGIYKTESLLTANPALLSQIASQIIEQEAPIMEDLLMRRMLEQFKESKLTNNMRHLIEEALKKVSSKKAREEGAPVYYGHLDSKEYTHYRRVADYRREISQIPLQELSNLLYALATEHAKDGLVTLTEEELMKQAAKTLGFSRTTAQMLERLTKALNRCMKRNLLRRNRHTHHLEIVETIF